MATTYSSLDVRDLFGVHAEDLVVSELHDGGPSRARAVVIDGSAQSWSDVSRQWPVRDRNSARFSWLAALPVLIIAVVRGTCDGAAASLVAQADLVFEVGQADIPQDIPAIGCRTEAEWEEHSSLLQQRLIQQPLASIVAAMCLREQRTRQSIGLESMAYSLLQAGPEYKTWLGSR
jgi:hypothetical protein